MMNRSLEGRERPAGYRMIEKVSVQNFRCFENFKLEKLRRINIVVGRNATGKTALLEALRMGAGGTPQAAAWINQVRGMMPAFIQGVMSREQFESLWNHFFFRIDASRRIRIAFHNSDGIETAVEVFYDPEQAITQVPELSRPQGPTEVVAIQRITLPTAIVPLVFRRSSPTIAGDLKATVLFAGQLHMEPGPELGPVTAVMGAMVGYTSQDGSAWLAQLVKENRESEILELVQREYPEVKITGLAVIGSPFPAIWASIPYLPEKIPISLLSSGINKFVTLIVAAHFYKRGLLLVDEIETGTYFDRLPSLWAALHRICKDNDNQVFATTHSYECLEAALEVIRADEKEFSLIRVRRSNGESTAKQFVGRDVVSAIEEGVEIR
jgi:predicted ATPase